MSATPDRATPAAHLSEKTMPYDLPQHEAERPRESADRAAPAIAVAGATKTYRAGDQTLHVLRDLHLDVAPGETVAILGVSGTGKSTLLNILGGLDQAEHGSITVGGVDLRAATTSRLARFRAESIAFIFQFYNLIPTLTVSENVLAGLQAARRTTEADEALVMDALRSVGLEAKAQAFPQELSGGQQQRVAIARALVKRAPVILADEPTGNLDRATAKDIIALLVDAARRRSAAVVLVTHDPSILAEVDHAYRLQDGRLVAE
ncbi:ABC transporter ATP-binding protein [Azospirillum sp.]|uniref:ABC transporter ATP-binding protein n=1 Tax=Azospirillum sp. TaxID=34012 RepID=UPI003D7240E1